MGKPNRLTQNNVYPLSDSAKQPEYRDVTIRTDVKVKELYDVEDRLGT